MVEVLKKLLVGLDFVVAERLRILSDLLLLRLLLH